MDLKQRIRVALGIDEEATEQNEVQLMFEDKLADGTIIVSEADELVAGVVLNILSEDGVQTPLPEGNYTTEAGVGFSVDASGVVLEVAEAVEETEAEDEEEEVALATESEIFAEVGTVVKELLEEVRNDISRLTAELDELRGENLAKDHNINELQDENTNLSAQITKLGSEASEEPIQASKFADQKSVSSKTYEDMNAQEKYLFNFNNQK
tara:strand:+ start:4075 stop:4704 length:630 start_codon:yes stop_codon:yes gene_type:complete